MARNPSSYARRQRELARQRKRAEKAKRKAERRERQANLDENDEDPDIAGIVPGPQPLPYDENGFTEEGEPDPSDDDDEATPQN